MRIVITIVLIEPKILPVPSMQKTALPFQDTKNRGFLLLLQGMGITVLNQAIPVPIITAATKTQGSCSN